MWQKVKKRVFVLFVCISIAGEKTMLSELIFHGKMRRWSSRRRSWPRGRPRGHILKFSALASEPHVLKHYPVLGSRTALLFEQLKFRWKTPETSRKFCEHLFFPYLEHRCSQGGGGKGTQSPTN